MNYFASTPGDRLAAAHEHFASSGMNAEKIILIAVIACVAGVLVYFAMKK